MLNSKNTETVVSQQKTYELDNGVLQVVTFCFEQQPCHIPVQRTVSLLQFFAQLQLTSATSSVL